MAVIKKIQKLAAALGGHRLVRPLISTLEVLEKAKTVREIIEHLNGLSLTAFVFVSVRNMTVQTAILLSMAITAVLAIIVAALAMWSKHQDEREARAHKHTHRRVGH